jgi:hypothetical protein
VEDEAGGGRWEKGESKEGSEEKEGERDQEETREIPRENVANKGVERRRT